MMPEVEVKKYIDRIKRIIPYITKKEDVKFYEGKIESLREVLEWIPEKKSGTDE